MTKFITLFGFCLFLLCISLSWSYETEKLKQSFQRIDENGDKEISFDELLTDLVKHAVRPGAANIDPAKDVFKFYDKDRDGAITLDEFIPKHDEL